MAEPTDDNVSAGTYVRLQADKAAFKAAFEADDRVSDDWNDAMENLCGTVVKVVHSASEALSKPSGLFGQDSVSLGPGLFGLSECTKDHPRRPTWYYPLSVVEVVLPTPPEQALNEKLFNLFTVEDSDVCCAATYTGLCCMARRARSATFCVCVAEKSAVCLPLVGSSLTIALISCEQSRARSWL